MADVLEELKLSHYYPQKLSLSEAIHLLGETQNDSQRQYGVEIVRKLLMFDSTALDSVTTDMNKRPNDTFRKQTETKDQNVSHSVRRLQKGSVRLPKSRRVHPMDLLVAAMNCCDDFLRQILMEKMFVNKLSIPILLPDVRNGSHAFLLLALRSLVPEVGLPHRLQESSSSLTDTLIDMRNPVVSFMRVGNLHRSKSKLVNELLNFTSFNTFYHRDCPNGYEKRTVSNGSIEAACFQSNTATEEEFNCKLLTTLNLRGDARHYPKQTLFLCQSSTLVVLMVDSFDNFKELYQNVLTNVDVSQTKVIVCHISSTEPDDDEGNKFDLFNDSSGHDVIASVSCDWIDEDKLSDAEFATDLRKTISELLRPNQGDSYKNIIQRGKKFGFSLDADKSEYETEKLSADKFVDLIFNLPPDCKPSILPLQGEPWVKIGKLEREQRAKSHDENLDEHFIAEKETQKRFQRQIQCRSLMNQNEVTKQLSSKLYVLQDQTLLYYLNSCKIKLDARSRAITSNLLQEYRQEKQKYPEKLPNEAKPGDKLSEMEARIENSTFGLEHFLRECGQMYEAIHSEEFRLREELKKATLTPDVILNFPIKVATLLLKGQPLELMDGDASNVPITWLKAVLDQLTIMTKNARVFVLSIIGIQSSGKSTLLNALFGLQFPVSSGRCTRGIYCHLVPVEKGSLIVEFDYVMVVDTEGLGSSEFTGKSTFRDNELATFAIGLADATIINMKGENWAEMKDILQIVAYGLIRVRKTKAELELMPRCMFVHQNVPAANAEEKNRLGQEKQLLLLDTAIKAAARVEGFKDINKFNDVIKIDPDSHSWYFPDLWSGSSPKARISQDYTGKANVLRQYLMRLMKKTPSRLTTSGFVLRLSDLWNAMLHNDFVLCFRNTKDIMLGTNLNDRIAHAVDSLRGLNKFEQKMIRESIMSFVSIDELRAANKRILKTVSEAVEQNFTEMSATMLDIINAADISSALKKQYDVSLSEIKDGELLRVIDETAREISVHMKTLEIGNWRRVRDFKNKLADLEKYSEEMEKDDLNETVTKTFEKRWEQLFAEKTQFVNERKRNAKSTIEQAIRASITKFAREYKFKLQNISLSELFKTHATVQMPPVTKEAIVRDRSKRFSWDLVFSKSDDVHKVESRFYEAYKKWELEFQDRRGLEFDASHLEHILLEVGQLLGISEKEEREVPPRSDEMCSSLPAGYNFTDDYAIAFINFACNYAYNRSLENSERFISLTDPLADIDERYFKSVSNFPYVSAEANIDAVSQKIFNYARRSFMKDLGELVKAEVCKEGNANPTFQSKRAFLRAMIIDLAQETVSFVDVVEGKKRLLKKFMLYVEMAESKTSRDFFHSDIIRMLKNVLVNESESESQTVFQKMVESNVGKIIERAIDALRHADANGKGCSREYIRIFKDELKVTSEIYFRIDNLSGFTEAVVKRLNNLYDDFLSEANSSFETIVCEDNKAAIRPLFDKIMGCREKCPFCSAPCSQSLEKHPEDHRANHYPMGISGTVDVWGLFTKAQETHDATREKTKKPRKLSLSTCQAMVGTRVDIRTKVTVNKATKWYRSDFHPFNKYKELNEYKRWDIPFSMDHNASLYWKWFMAQFVKELAERYSALCPEIPETWQKVTWEEAKRSLDDLTF